MPAQPKSRMIMSKATSSLHLTVVAFLVVVRLDIASSQFMTRPSIQGSLFVQEGATYNLKCTHLSDQESVQLTWSPPDGVIISPPTAVSTSPASGIFQVTSDLTGTATRLMNSGVFTCIARNGAETSRDLFRIRVKVPPTNPVIMGPSTIGAGVTGSWNCSSDRGEPVPNLSWRRGTTAILSGISVANVLNMDDNTFNTTSVLTYTPTSADANLTLTCEMTQEQSGTVTATFSVSVQLKPTVTVSTGPLTWLRGQRLSVINCSAVASPTVTAITWYKNGAVLTTSGGNFQFGSVPTPSLTLTLVREEDEGSYICSATNSQGQTNSTAVLLSVVYPPDVTSASMEIVATLFQAVTVPCNISAKPSVMAVTWSRRSDGVTSSVDVTNTARFSGGTTSDPSLVIKSFAGSDAGTYRCTANNTYGTRFAEVNVTTRYAPRDITVNGSSVVVMRGSDVTVLCSAAAAPAANYSWTQGGQLVAATPTLQLTSVTSSAGGNYTCTASNVLGSLSASVVIQVQYPPVINSSVPALGLVVGGNLTIPCPVSAQPPPTNVTWSRDGVVVDVTQPRYRGGTVSTPDLTITSLTASDRGAYQCVVTNSLGSAASLPVNVTISYAPTNVTTLPSNRASLLEGGNVTLSCLADGVPSPQVTWSFKGTLIQGQASFTLVSVSRLNAGLYTCNASNNLGAASASLVLDVLYEPRVTSLPGGVVTGRNGSDVTLPCSFEANPAANGVAWYRNGAALTFSSPRYSGGSLATPSLTISGFRPDDVGGYICNVTNAVGIGYVTVTAAVTYPPTNMAINPSAISVRELSPFTATCSASAQPAANLTWYRNGAIFQNGGTLLVASATSEHDVVFTCMASNLQGNASMDLRVNVSYAPVVTTNVTQHGADLYQSVTLPCHVMANPAPTSIRWMRLVDTSVTAIDVSSSGGKYSGGSVATPALTIHNLTADDRGRYRCEATNSIGTTYSPEVNVTITYSPGVVTVTGPSSTVLEGTNISLGCQADGFPVPTLSWNRQTSGSPIATGSTLRLTASAQDNTVFQCVARNVKGQAIGVINVSVSYKPVSAVTTPSYDVSIGGTVTLDCNVNANPAPAVNAYTWYFRGSTLNVTSRYLVVTVHNSSYYGDYSCTATNSAGTSPPIVISVAQPGTTGGPQTVAPPEGSLSVTTILIIILIILVVIAIIIMVIVICYVRGKKKAKGQVHPEEGAIKPAKTQGTMNTYTDRQTGSSILSRKDVNVSLPANGIGKTPAISLQDGEVGPAAAAEENTGPIISLKDEEGQKPHHLPAMKYPTDVILSEPRRNRRRKKKKAQRKGDGERLVEGQGHPGQSTPPASESGKPPLPPAAGETSTASGVPVTEL